MQLVNTGAMPSQLMTNAGVVRACPNHLHSTDKWSVVAVSLAPSFTTSVPHNHANGSLRIETSQYTLSAKSVCVMDRALAPEGTGDKPMPA